MTGLKYIMTSYFFNVIHERPKKKFYILTYTFSRTRLYLRKRVGCLCGFV